MRAWLRCELSGGMLVNLWGGLETSAAHSVLLLARLRREYPRDTDICYDMSTRPP